MSDLKVIGKHTPGPWFSPDGKTIKQDYRDIGVTEFSGCIIAVVTGGPKSGSYFIESTEEVEANSSLIAAAPDLLEALQNMADSYEKYKIDAFLEGELESARAAIAKAKGLAQ